MMYSVNNTQFTCEDERVSHQGKPLSLSPRGHACLMLFLASNHQVQTKDALMKALWPDVVVSDDSLFKVIQEVRQALKSAGLGSDCISNVYGKGYQFKPEVKVSGVKTSQPHWWLAGALLVAIAAGLFWWQSGQPGRVVTDQSFADKINLIESDYRAAQQVDLSAFEEATHPEDQLRLGYLRGYALYKTGQYDECIDVLLAAVGKYGTEPANKVLADTYLLLSKMHIYREDKSALKSYLDQAQSQYEAVGNTAGLISTKIERARYHQVIQEHDRAIELLKSTLESAVEADDAFNQLRAHSNLAYSYERINQVGLAFRAHQATLELALAIPDPRYAAYSYGALSDVSMVQGEPRQAMQYATLALKYVLAQKDTNVFQQGFSYFYLLLPQLGHWELAEKYLQAALDIQAGFNPEGRLVVAELYQAKVKMARQKHAEAQTLLQSLLAHGLAEPERLQAEALLALNAAHRGDNINAYAKAKLVLAAEERNQLADLNAGLALVSAAHALERHEEAELAYVALRAAAKPNLLFEYQQYLDLSEWLYAEVNPHPALLSETQAMIGLHQQQLADLTQHTEPDSGLMNELSQYLAGIMKQ